MTPATGVRVLLSEGSSLTAREFISVLGPMGYRIEVMDPNRACQARWSRWVRHVHPCPPAGIDPLGYLHAVREVLLRGRFHVLLPTHEQAWLFAIARNRLPTAIGLAVAAPHAFAAVQSKIDFARLLDEMALPQPSWTLVASAADLPDWPAPYYLKTAYSTAGQGVRRVPTSGEAASALRDLLTMSQGHPVMAQRAAPGRYGQVQGLFRHGQMIAVHTSTQTAIGIGPSAAGREHRPPARPRPCGGHRPSAGLARRPHAGLLLRRPTAALHRVQPPHRRAGQRRTQRHQPPSGADRAVPRRADRGAAARTGRGPHPQRARRAAGDSRPCRHPPAEIAKLANHRGEFTGSAETLTPIRRDPPSLVPLAAVTAQLLVAPCRAGRLSRATVASYALGADALANLDSDDPP